MLRRKGIALGTFAKDNKHGVLHLRVDIEVRETEKGPELSICGDTYRIGARDIESCGQICDEVRRLLDDKGATLVKPRADIERLLEVWDRWHLNGMRPGCVHQVGPEWDFAREVTLVTYQLKPDVRDTQRSIRDLALRSLAVTGAACYGPSEQTVVNLPSEQVVPDTENTQEQFKARNLDLYKVTKRETKRASWVKPEEHPAGYLCKPCPTCGYKYGSAWVYEPLPTDVVEFVTSF